MKRIDSKILIFTCMLCLSPMILGIWVYQSLPDVIAVHFDVNNIPDGFMQKEFFVFAGPVVMMLIQVFLCIVTDLSDTNNEKNNKQPLILKFIIPAVTLIMYVLTIVYALGNGLDMSTIAAIIVGVIFIVIGIYLPKTTSNTNINFPKIKDENADKRARKIFRLLDDYKWCVGYSRYII